MDAKTAAQIRSLGFDPAKLPAGTLIGGKGLSELTEAAKERKGPNKTESAWIRHLDWLVSIGKVKYYRYEPFRLRLTDPDPQTHRQTYFVPDFLVVMSAEWQYDDSRPRVVEIKGMFVRDDADVKFRLAMKEYASAFRFSMVQRQPGGNWNTILGETWNP